MRFPFNLPPAAEFDVVGFGTNAVDFLIRVPNNPDYNSKVEHGENDQGPRGEVASPTT